MDNHIAITALNDFIFCPYSIYLHAVYMGSDEDILQRPYLRSKGLSPIAA